MRILELTETALPNVVSSSGNLTNCISVEARFLPSDFIFFLYEINAWLGGPGHRTLDVKSLANYQPSLDAIWKNLFGVSKDQAKSGFRIEFARFDYQNLDQLCETAEQRKEVQLLLSCLVLVIQGGSHCVLTGDSNDKHIELVEDMINLRCCSQPDHLMAEGILNSHKIGLKDE